MVAVAHRRATTVVAALLSAALVLLGVARISTAGFTAATANDGGWASGTVEISDDDTGAAMFDTATLGLMDGGQSLTRCIAVTYTGTITSGIAVRVHAATSGPLAAHLLLTVEEGTGGAAGTCTGFTPTATLYSGTLAGFAADHATFATGASSWAVAATPETRTYRFTTTVENVPAAQAKAATATFTWEAGRHEFTPAALPNKALWLRAKDVSGATGTPVTSWLDQSGLHRHAVGTATVPTLAAGATPAGGAAIRFNKTGAFNLPYLGLNRYSATTNSPRTPAAGAVDGNAGTYWRSNGVPAELAVETRQPYVETSYSLQPAATTGGGPTSFTFEGSSDGGATWKVLDARTGVTWPSLAAKQFTFANSTAYSRYRLNVTATGGGQVYLGEITLHGDPAVSATAGEMWVVLRGVSTGATDSQWSLGTGGAPYYTSGSIGDNFGAATAATFTPTVPTSTWRLYRVSTDGTTWRAFLDGALQHTRSAVPVAWPQTGYLGWRGVNLWAGDVAEVLIRDRIATPGEAAALIGYFNAEHGLSVPAF